jgi:hypothetical protein
LPTLARAKLKFLAGTVPSKRGAGKGRHNEKIQSS